MNFKNVMASQLTAKLQDKKMLKSVSGSLTVKTDNFSSKLTIPAKSMLSGQLTDLLCFVENVLRQHGDNEITKRFANNLLKNSGVAE